MLLLLSSMLHLSPLQILVTNFSLAVVISELDREVNITVSHYAQDFVYHRLDLIQDSRQQGGVDKCQHQQRLSTNRT